MKHNIFRIFMLLALLVIGTVITNAQDTDLSEPEIFVLFYVDNVSSLCLRDALGNGGRSIDEGEVVYAISVDQSGEWVEVRFQENNTRWIAADFLNPVQGFGDEIGNLPTVELPFDDTALEPCFPNNGNNAGESTGGQTGNSIVIGSTTYIFQSVTISSGMTIQESYGGHGTIVNGPTVAGGNVAFALFSFDNTGLNAVSAQPAGVQFGAYQGNHPNVIANQFASGACGSPSGCASVRVFIRINGVIIEGFPQ